MMMMPGFVDGDHELCRPVGLSSDLAAAVPAGFGAGGVHRKKRMARHRRSSNSHLHFSFPPLPPLPRVLRTTTLYSSLSLSLSLIL